MPFAQAGFAASCASIAASQASCVASDRPAINSCVTPFLFSGGGGNRSSSFCNRLSTWTMFSPAFVFQVRQAGPQNLASREAGQNSQRLLGKRQACTFHFRRL